MNRVTIQYQLLIAIISLIQLRIHINFIKRHFNLDAYGLMHIPLHFFTVKLSFYVIVDLLKEDHKFAMLYNFQILLLSP